MNYTDYRQNLTVQYCFPDNNLSCRKEVRTGPAYIFLFIFFTCLSAFTVFLNLLVIISISHFKQLHTPTNLIILSLAVADIFVGLFVMPVNIMELIDSCWYLGKLACSIVQLISSVVLTSSIFSLVLIAVDRFIAVCDPLLYSTRVTVCKTSLLIILGWSLCLFYIILIFYFNDNLLPSQFTTSCYGECAMVIQYSWEIVDLVLSFIAPCSIIIVLYSVIFMVARRQAKAVQALKNATSRNQEIKISSSSETKAAKKLSTIIFIFLASWIPFYISFLLSTSSTYVPVVYYVLSWLVSMNSSVNPLMYAILYSWFRKSVKYIVTCRIFQPSSSRFHLFSEHS